MLLGRRSIPHRTASAGGAPPTAHRRAFNTRFLPRAIAPDTIHLSEGIILAGAALSFSLPFVWNRFKARVQELPLAQACRPGTVVLDVRTQEQRVAQGIPAVPDGVTILHAPWMTHSGNGFCQRSVHFADDVTFAANSAAPGSPLVIMDMFGECGPAAAGDIAKLGTHCTVQLAQGGFVAWMAAGLPTTQAAGGGYSSGLDVDDLLCELEEEPAEQPMFRPKLLDVLASGYTLQDFKTDVFSGAVVGIIALPLSMALGIASESTPAVGLTTAVVAGFLISALGGSRVNIGGPTAAFIPIVLGVAHNYGPQNLIICTGMSGLMLMALGLTGLGSSIKFIPKPVVVGFTAGIATFMFSTQVKDFFGLGATGGLPEGSSIPSQFVEKLYFLGSHLDGTHLPSLALAAGSLALTLAWPKAWGKVAPPQIVTVVAATAGLAALDHLTGGGVAQAGAEAAATGAFGIETIGSHFGAHAIPSGLPMPRWPEGLDSVQMLGPLVQPAIGITLLGCIESLLCSRVGDTMIADKHNPNTELIAQGIANIASAAFGGLPATAALARTAVNARCGGRSPVAGMVHAATILVIMSVAAPLAGYIPLPSLAAVLVVVAISMGGWHHFRQLSSWPEKDAQLFLLAFFLTVMQDVALAVELGVAAAVLLFVRDVTGTLKVRSHEEGEHPSLPRPYPASPVNFVPSNRSDRFLTAGNKNSWNSVMSLSGEDDDDDGGLTLAPLQVPAGARFLDVTGSLQFGAGAPLEQAVASLVSPADATTTSTSASSRAPVRVLVLGMSHLSMCDVSGLEVLEELAATLHKAGVSLIIVGATQQPLQVMSRAGFLKEVGAANVCRTLDTAFARAEQLVAAARSSSPPTDNPPPTAGPRSNKALELALVSATKKK